MTVNAIITNDCKYINLVMTGAPGNANIDIAAPDGTPSYNATVNIPASGNANHLAYLPSALGTGDGVFSINVTDSQQDEAFAGVFGSCSLDCCIAKKIDILMQCGCGCLKCNESLVQAERVHLLISGIRADLSLIGPDTIRNTGLFKNAVEKYNKALELCSDDCGCGC